MVKTSFKVGDKVRMLKDIDFKYHDKGSPFLARIVNVGDTDAISLIDGEGYWLKEREIYIEHGYESTYFEIIGG